jgi:hypothetical protein
MKMRMYIKKYEILNPRSHVGVHTNGRIILKWILMIQGIIT